MLELCQTLVWVRLGWLGKKSVFFFFMHARMMPTANACDSQADALSILVSKSRVFFKWPVQHKIEGVCEGV
jgi:hypothetical protein